jgi:hypothetical protein
MLTAYFMRVMMEAVRLHGPISQKHVTFCIVSFKLRKLCPETHLCESQSGLDAVRKTKISISARNKTPAIQRAAGRFVDGVIVVPSQLIVVLNITLPDGLLIMATYRENI